MSFLPTRIMIKLTPDLSRALGERARRDDDDPRITAARLLREALDLPPLCPMCGIPTFHKDGVWYCRQCNEAVIFRPADSD